MPERGVVISVAAARGAYPVRIEAGSLARSWEYLGEVLAGRKVVIITQRRIRRMHGKALLASWPQDQRPLWLEVPQGEKAKTLRWFERLLARMAREGVTRSAAVVAFGGGVVGDLAGFVAASFMRGVRWVQVPTTLLAQVDSSVGGKVAVNLPQGKNLVGAFYPPDAVLMDPEVLRTLPRRELRAGAAEVVKYGLLRDPDFFARCEAEFPEPADWAPFLEASVRHKAAVVEADERESGARMGLNLGHTLGHALEAHGGFRRYKHGEAVAMGTRYVFRLGLALGAVDAAVVDRVEAFYRERLPMPRLPHLRFEGLLASMRRDKKADAAGIRWVLPTGLGAWRLEAGVPDATLAAVYKECLDVQK